MLSCHVFFFLFFASFSFFAENLVFGIGLRCIFDFFGEVGGDLGSMQKGRKEEGKRERFR